MPFARVVAGESHMIDSNGSVTVQFFDIMGNPIGVKGRKLSSAKLVYINLEYVDATAVATLDDNAGKVTIKLAKSLDLSRGAFYPHINLIDDKGTIFGFKTFESVTLQTEAVFKKFSYSITTDEEHSTEGKEWTHPTHVSDF